MSTMTDRIWVLGAADPEMEAIEQILRECGETVAYALDERGERVHSGNAYRARDISDGFAWGTVTHLVECDALPYSYPAHWEECDGYCPTGEHEHVATPALRDVVRIDHHRPGDPGYGRPPSEFLAASSIGQVIAELARLGRLPESWASTARSFGDPGQFVIDADSPGWCVVTRSGRFGYDLRDFDSGATDSTALVVPYGLVLTAAADHCLGAAYRGECPGVDPDELMRWRAESRAKFQGRQVDEVLSDMELTREAISRAPKLWIAGRFVVDLRDAYTVSTMLVEPFSEGASVDSAGVGDSKCIEFGDHVEGAWDEGSHHTFVRRGVAELPDAASREGVAYLAYVGSGRPKIVLGGCTTPEMVRAFLDHWAPSQGLMDLYGDPQRGFAGGYLSE